MIETLLGCPRLGGNAVIRKHPACRRQGGDPFKYSDLRGACAALANAGPPWAVVVGPDEKGPGALGSRPHSLQSTRRSSRTASKTAGRGGQGLFFDNSPAGDACRAWPVETTAFSRSNSSGPVKPTTVIGRIRIPAVRRIIYTDKSDWRTGCSAPSYLATRSANGSSRWVDCTYDVAGGRDARPPPKGPAPLFDAEGLPIALRHQFIFKGGGFYLGRRQPNNLPIR